MRAQDPDRDERLAVLVVDDESAVRHVLEAWLTRNGCEVRCAESAERALELLAEWSPGVALLDIVLPGRSGLDLLTEIQQCSPHTEFVLITGHGSVDTAAEAIRRGAYDCMQKPFSSLDDVWQTVLRGFEKRRLGMELREMAEAQGDCTEPIVSTVDELRTRHGGDGRPRGAGS